MSRDDARPAKAGRSATGAARRTGEVAQLPKSRRSAHRDAGPSHQWIMAVAGVILLVMIAGAWLVFR